MPEDLGVVDADAAVIVHDDHGLGGSGGCRRRRGDEEPEVSAVIMGGVHQWQ